jgi:hypothetical protein
MPGWQRKAYEQDNLFREAVEAFGGSLFQKRRLRLLEKYKVPKNNALSPDISLLSA